MNTTQATASSALVPIPGGELAVGLTRAAAEEVATRLYGKRGAAVKTSAFFAEVPAHRVFIPPFRLQKTEVTNAEYKQFADAGGYKQEQWWGELVARPDLNCNGVGFERVARFVDATGQPGPATWRKGSFPKGKERHPVDGISWFEAAACATWRGLRLPTEEEWEYAARGTDGRTYPWGDSEAPLAKIVRVQAGLTPVGSIPEDKSPFGIMDMARNAAEWVADVWLPYAGSPLGQLPKVDEDWGVVRGGMYLSQADQMRTTNRWRMSRLARRPGIGFRCAADAK